MKKDKGGCRIFGKYNNCKYLLVISTVLAVLIIGSMVYIQMDRRGQEVGFESEEIGVVVTETPSISPTPTPIVSATVTPTKVKVTPAISAKDVTKPLVVIVSPNNHSQVSGVVKIVANVTDNVGVDRVEFYAGSGDFEHIGTATKAPYEVSWDINKKFGSSPWNIPVTATAYDKAGNRGYDGININPYSQGKDMTGPEIRILEPADGARIGKSVTIRVEVSDNNGVRDVDVFAGSSLEKYITRLSTIPRQVTWQVDSQYWQMSSFPITIVANDVDYNSTKKTIIVYPNR